MDDDRMPEASPATWNAALQRAEVDIAAGRVVGAEAVMRRLDESIARMQRAARPDSALTQNQPKAANRR